MVTTRPLKTKPRRRLNKTAIDALKPEAEPYRVPDSDIPGFDVRVAPSGYKSWRVEYRVAPGGRGAPVKRMTLGSSTEITAEQARKQALAIRAAAAQGLDPAAERSARRRELTVLQLIELYLAEGLTVQSGHRAGAPMKPATVQGVTAVLLHHVAPLIGAKKLGDIGPGDMERFNRAVAAGKTAKLRDRRQVGRHVRGGLSAATKAVRIVSAMFSFAMRRGLMAANPCPSPRFAAPTLAASVISASTRSPGWAPPSALLRRQTRSTRRPLTSFACCCLPAVVATRSTGSPGTRSI